MKYLQLAAALVGSLMLIGVPAASADVVYQYPAGQSVTGSSG
jgi:hypothetical protein